VGRLLVLVILIVVAVWLVRRALRRMADKDRPSAAHLPDELVRCAHCGVLLPRGEARQAAGALYCGDEHATKGPGPR
jgi:uncharacterized protein